MNNKSLKILHLIITFATVVMTAVTIRLYLEAPTVTKFTGPSCPVCLDVGSSYQEKNLTRFYQSASITGVLLASDLVVLFFVRESKLKPDKSNKKLF